MDRVAPAKRPRDDAFTLIELLVVCLILGILAAVTIPAFVAQRQRAWMAASVSVLDFAVIEIETSAAASGGDYSGITQADVDALGLAFQPGAAAPVQLELVNADTVAFCLAATHDLLVGIDGVEGGYAGDDPIVVYESDEGGLRGPDLDGALSCVD